MSEGADGGSRPHAGLEKKSLDRLRNLISNFSDEAFRPPVRAATRILLAGDDDALRKGNIALELQRRTVWLDHTKTFSPTGPGSAAIDLFTVDARQSGRPIARLVRKTVYGAITRERGLGWIGEALFYLEIAPHLNLPETRIPRLHGCRLEENSVVLVLEYLEPAPPRPTSLDRIARSARLAGKLGAATHRNKLYTAGWISPISPRLPPETLFALESLAAHCFSRSGEQTRIVNAIETLIGSPDIVARIRAHAYPSLTHGDLHMRNIFAMADVPGDVAVIDWGKVCEAPIGHDALLLLLPRFIGSCEWGGREFGAAVELVQRDVIAGALSIDPSLDPARIRLGLEIGLVFHTAVLAARNLLAWTKHGPDQQRRVATLLRDVAGIAEAMLREFGS